VKITYAITKGNWGGAQKYVFELAEAMKKAGHDVSLVFGDPGKLKEYADEAGLKSIPLPQMKRDINIFKELSSFFALLKILKDERPDVLHLNSPKMGGLGSLAARIAGIPRIIYTAHGWTFNEDRSFISTFLIKIISWFTILFCDEVIVLSETEKQQVVRWPGAKNKIRIIPLSIKGIDFIERQAAQSILRQSCPNIPLSAEITWLGNIAELHKNKGLEYAIEAVNALPPRFNCIYVIIGTGEKQQELQALIEKYNLKDKVFLAGFQQNAARLLRAFDIFFFSSIKEGLPYTLLEAGAAGLPVISTDVGSIADLISDRRSGLLVPSKNPKRLEESLEELLNDPLARKEYASALCRKVISLFSFDAMVKKVLSSYTG
jgi:glycosyltransferase involved in cell wall biosynthesis